MQYLPIILTVATIHLLAVISPGPDFIMIVRNTLKYGRSSGIYSAIGLGLGILLHLTYCLAGIAILISKSLLLFSILKYIGAAYLIYIGYMTVRSRTQESSIPSEQKSREELKPIQAAKIGFITNATNPKATLFFLSLFTLVIQPSTPFWVKSIMGIEMVAVTIMWFTLLSIVLSHQNVSSKIAKIQHKIERFTGVVLILFGIKLAAIHSK